MAVTVTLMRTRFPTTFGDAVAYPSTYLADYIGAAELRVDREVFGVYADEAVLYKAAELALLDPQNTSAGVKRAKAGHVEIEYGDNDTRGADWFAEEFKTLQRMAVAVGDVPGGTLVC